MTCTAAHLQHRGSFKPVNSTRKSVLKISLPVAMAGLLAPNALAGENQNQSDTKEDCLGVEGWTVATAIHLAQ